MGLRPSELVGIRCPHCAFCFDDLIRVCEVLASRPSKEEREQAEAEATVAEHKERIAAFEGHR